MGDGPPTVARIVLDTQARVPGIEGGEFQELAEGAKQNCPISRALAAVPTIEVNAELVA
jgi:lipoyl-dependent peroxiredoxin